MCSWDRVLRDVSFPSPTPHRYLGNVCTGAKTRFCGDWSVFGWLCFWLLFWNCKVWVRRGWCDCSETRQGHKQNLLLLLLCLLPESQILSYLRSGFLGKPHRTAISPNSTPRKLRLCPAGGFLQDVTHVRLCVRETQLNTAALGSRASHSFKNTSTETTDASAAWVNLFMKMYQIFTWDHQKYLGGT